MVSDIKIADDHRGIIVRGYEMTGLNSQVTLKFPLQVERANATDLIEEDDSEAVDMHGGQLQFRAKHFAIDTFRIIGRYNGQSAPPSQGGDFEISRIACSSSFGWGKHWRLILGRQ